MPGADGAASREASRAGFECCEVPLPGSWRMSATACAEDMAGEARSYSSAQIVVG